MQILRHVTISFIKVYFGLKGNLILKWKWNPSKVFLNVLIRLPEHLLDEMNCCCIVSAAGTVSWGALWMDFPTCGLEYQFVAWLFC